MESVVDDSITGIDWLIVLLGLITFSIKKGSIRKPGWQIIENTPDQFTKPQWLN